jgi:hypothetical protein
MGRLYYPDLGVSTSFCECFLRREQVQTFKDSVTGKIHQFEDDVIAAEVAGAYSFTTAHGLLLKTPTTLKPYTIPSPTPGQVLALAKFGAWTRIKTARNTAIASGVPYNGNVYDSDATAQLRIMGAAQMAQLAISSGTAYSVTWTLQNNSLVTLTAQEVIALAMAVGQNYQTLFGKGQSLRAQITAATTQSQLDAIVW